MKKFLKSKIALVGIFVFIIGVICLAYQTYRKYELTQFVMWSPRATIKDYVFLDDNKAVAIHWDNETELKEAEEAKKYDPRIDVDYYKRTNGERFIVQQSYKLKSAPYKYWTLKEDAVPFLNRNIPEDGEYWLLDVYDTKDGKIKQKTYDVFKMVREYNKEYVPYNIPDTELLLQTEQGKSYLPIRMVVSRQPKFKGEYGVIDIETGKILPATPSGKKGEDFYDIFRTNSSMNKNNKIYVEDIINQNNHLTEPNIYFGLSILRFNKPLKDNSMVQLKSKQPEVFYILNQGISSELYFLGEEDVQLKISLLKLVLPEGTNIFKDITIPADSSIDGQEHIVQSEEEFLQYYQSSSWDE